MKIGAKSRTTRISENASVNTNNYHSHYSDDLEKNNDNYIKYFK